MSANTVPLPATPALRLLRLARRFVDALVLARRGPVQGVQELMGMSERELSDLGIGRSEIPHVLEAQARASRSCAWRG